MTAEDENGELKQLLEIKRAYRRSLTTFEEETRTKFERELAEGKKRLQGQYLESIVDAVFAEAAPTPPVEESAPALEPMLAPTPTPVEVKLVCPDCESPIALSDKFCPQCATPLKEDEKLGQQVGVTSRHIRTRGRS